MSSQICLKWNSFLNNIAKSFENLWQEEGLVDVTLACNGRCLTAHKVILSASSPFFKKVFETNPCQHPVIILQDVNFSDLQALLIFIYKGEVNIEQDQLPALLKTADTLQIRGLSGGDVFTNESYKRLIEWDQNNDEAINLNSEETPKKKHKSSRSQSSSVFDKALTPRKSRSSSSSESLSNERNSSENDDMAAEYPSIEMKAEPLETLVDEIEKQIVEDSQQFKDRLDTGQPDSLGTENKSTQGANNTTIGNDSVKTMEPILYDYQRLPYADLLPSPDVLSTWASSRPMDYLACDLMKILFTHEERIHCNVNGKMGKKQFDSDKIHLIREVLLHFSDISPNSVEWEERWKNCVTKIDTSNRGLKRYLVQRKAVYIR